MPVKKKKKPPFAKVKPEISDTEAIQVVLNAQLAANDLEKELVDTKRQLLCERNEHNALKQKLVGFLNRDQIEAAGIAGCAPEVYAMEWLDICKDRVRELTPAFTGYVHSLRAIKEGNY